jgi:hypothetical protein
MTAPLWRSPPGLRGSPWTRRSPSKPTGASAADQGVRPTVDAQLSSARTRVNAQ